jgi:hypothetical protein
MVLMDHWVSLFMSAQSPHHDQQTDARTRYSTALCLLYFLMSAITVDMTLQQYWEKTSKLSDERLVDLQHAHAVRENILKDRRLLWIEGCIDLAKKMGFVLGLVLLSLAFLVENPSDITLFYAYVIGYTSALFTQVSSIFFRVAPCKGECACQDLIKVFSPKLSCHPRESLSR